MLDLHLVLGQVLGLLELVPVLVILEMKMVLSSMVEESVLVEDLLVEMGDIYGTYLWDVGCHGRHIHLDQCCLVRLLPTQ